MKLESQVVSLDLAKRLKELGVKQESYFYHYATAIEQDGLAWWNVLEKEPRKGKRVRAYLDSVGRPSMLSAFTVAELGEMLPEKYDIPRKSWEPDADAFLWGIYLEKPKPVIIQAFTEADARAKMLIYLLENGLIAGV